MPRSLLFYLALPVLIFLLWAWVDSMSQESGIEIRKHTVSPTRTSLSRDSLRNRNSAVEIIVNHPSHGDRARTERDLIILPRSPASGGSWWPAAEYAREQEFDSPAFSRSAIIPHWLLVLLYLILWSLAFTWRHRRLKRASKLHSPAQPQTDL
jgi:hypothetical protein